MHHSIIGVSRVFAGVDDEARQRVVAWQSRCTELVTELRPKKWNCGVVC